MKPDFSKVKFIAGAKDSGVSNPWLSPEGISIPGKFALEDILKSEVTEGVAGKPPYLRGPYATMYTARP
jgi:methylmalonyl-CoA mutase